MHKAVQKLIDTYKSNPSLLKKFSSKKEDAPVTRAYLLDRYRLRVKLLNKLGAIKEALYPNDHFHHEDVAFGLLKNHRFIAATDFEGVDKKESGYISHIAMLQAIGLADPEKIETEFVRSKNSSLTDDHYVVRGIVKAGLNGDILFWESPMDILENSTFFEGVLKCLRELKKRHLIKDSAKVHGSGVRGKTSLGTVKELLQAD